MFEFILYLAMFVIHIILFVTSKLHETHPLTMKVFKVIGAIFAAVITVNFIISIYG